MRVPLRRFFWRVLKRGTSAGVKYASGEECEGSCLFGGDGVGVCGVVVLFEGVV